MSHQSDFDHELRNELELLLNEVPVLYKYIDFEGALKLVSNSKILIRKPSTFNDPYDCHPNLVDLEDMPDNEVEILINKYFNHLPANERRKLIHASITGIKKEIIELLKHELFENERSTRGIVCFSKSFDNLRMWSQYADSHSGICIGFHLSKLYLDLRESPYPEIALLGVKYSTAFERLKYFENKRKAFINWLRTKSDLWEYEKEVRISLGPLDFRDKEYELVPFNLQSIKCIYFGSKTPDNSVNTLKKMCDSLDLNIDFNKMNLSPSSFLLTKHRL